MEPKTKMVFRKFKNGEVIALMPEVPADTAGQFVQSYMFIGQHSAASYDGVMADTKPAKKEEYEGLLRELEKEVGYNVKVVTRRTPEMIKEFWGEVRKEREYFQS